MQLKPCFWTELPLHQSGRQSECEQIFLILPLKHLNLRRHGFFESAETR